MSTTKQTLRLFWRFNRPQRAYFWAGNIGSVLGVVFQDIIPPIIVAKAFLKLQTAFDAQQQMNLHEFVPYMVLFAVSMIFGFIVWRLQSYWIWEMEIKTKRDISIFLYNHIQYQSQRFHADRFSGSMVSQVNKFTSAYEQVMDDFTWNIVNGLATLLFSIGVLLFVSWKYALVVIVVMTLYFALMSLRNKHQLPYNKRQSVADTEQTAALADAITNSSTVRSFAGEKYESERFRKVAEHNQKLSHELSIQAFKTETLSHFQTSSFHIIAFVSGIVAIVSYGANVGALYLILSYTGSIVNRLWTYGYVMRSFNRSFGNAMEMTEILGIEPEVADPKVPQIANISRGAIEFRKMTFGYPEDSEHPLFKNLSLKLKPGEKVGLVGPSGGGKTTITKLLLRFMDIQSGQILLDRQDITTITQADLRSAITYVAQEPILFHRSLFENIAYGNPDATIKEVKAVAKMAHADEFIDKLPNSYDTMVGERGIKLSGGQRQRVAIARAMLKNAPILVLDEATSALDSESEALIQDALWKLMEGKTAIVIAHRLSTIQRMDRIVVLADGAIKEQGSHKELLSKNGAYASLWNHQSGGFMKD